jgi:2-polyprenyl-6-methoxyphenol hydroxylase-like FAD-dependent oxidoreductase
MPDPFNPNIIIVGAGPSGLLLTLLLARLHTSPILKSQPQAPNTQHKPIRVLLLDQSPTLDTNPRATHYGSPAMNILARAGVVDDMRRIGFTPDTVCWRKLSGERIAGIGFQAMSKGVEGEHGEETGMVGMVVLPLNRLGKLLMEHLRGYEEEGIVRIEWGRKVVGVGQEGGGAWVEVEGGGVKERIEAEYVVGCDGANSAVRRCLFGKGEDAFPGKTWDEQIVATNVSLPFMSLIFFASRFVHADRDRLITISLRLAGKTRISSSTLSIGIWLPKSHEMACGVSRMVNCQA